MSEEEKKAPAAKPSGGPNIILIAILVFIGSFGGSILAFQILPKTVTVNQTIHEPADPDEHSMLPVQPVGDFVINLADVSGSRFLKMSLTAKLYSEDFEEYEALAGEEKHAYHARIEEDLAHSMPAIKDVIITSLSRKTANEVMGYENKLALKMELKEQLAHVMHGEFQVYDLYFTEFIVQ